MLHIHTLCFLNERMNERMNERFDFIRFDKTIMDAICRCVDEHVRDNEHVNLSILSFLFK